MSITIPPDLEARIRAKVDAGQFASVDAALAEAVELLDRAAERLQRVERLRALISEGAEREMIPLTEELKAASWERAKRRARAGERPNPDVMPPDERT